MIHAYDQASPKARPYHEKRSNKAKERKRGRESANGDSHRIPSKAQNGHDL
jgi:hypothetical protein